MERYGLSWRGRRSSFKMGLGLVRLLRAHLTEDGYKGVFELRNPWKNSAIFSKENIADSKEDKLKWRGPGTHPVSSPRIGMTTVGAGAQKINFFGRHTRSNPDPRRIHQG